jgi:hypothetical protein
MLSYHDSTREAGLFVVSGNRRHGAMTVPIEKKRGTELRA